MDSLSEILSKRQQRVIKCDGSYVTEGDLTVQALLTNLAKNHFPDAKIVSEEMPAEKNVRGDTGKVIVIDPIDGTENFTSGFPLWGVSIACYENGMHSASILGCPELDKWVISGESSYLKFQSRIKGLSSSLTKEDIMSVSQGFEYRIFGCCVFNMMSVINGSLKSFENFKGAWSWDILGGLNLALEAGLDVIVDDMPYDGKYLYPDRKYTFKIEKNI